MTKVLGNISQLGVSGSIAQLSILGSVAQLDITGSIVESGYVPDPPLFVSAINDDFPTNVIELLFDRALDGSSVPDITDFVITLTGGAINVTSISFPITVGMIYLFLSRAINYGETGTIAYTPGTYPIKSDTTGDPADAFTKAITNNRSVGTAPVFVSAAVANATPTKVVLTYDQTLDTASVPATTDFTVTDHTVSNVAIVGATVELTLSTAVIYFDIIYVTYTEGANPIQGDVGGVDADNLASTLITNNVAVTGNEIGWWLASDLATITKDGSNFVSAWNDKLASGRNLLQATGTNQPLWSASGITFDGLDNYLKAAAFNWNTYGIYIVGTFISWAASDYMFDGDTDLKYYLGQRTITPNVSLDNNAALENANMTLNTMHVVRIINDGANGQKIQIDATTATTATKAATANNGFTLGCRGSLASRFGHFIVAEIILLIAAQSAEYQTSLYNVMKRRAGL